MKKRLLLSLLLLGILYFEIGQAQPADFPNVLDKGGIQVLCKSAVAVSAPVDTTEDTLATCTVPANAMGANGVLRIRTRWSATNNVNNKIIRTRFSTVAGTTFGLITTANWGYQQLEVTISNRNATNSQEGAQISFVNSALLASSTTTTSAVDTTAATTIVITGQKATAGDTLTLESYLVELMPSN